MAKLTPQQIYALAKSVGLSPPRALVATAIALAESGGDTSIFSEPNADGSIDRGLWQINNKAHPDILDSCALDAVCNAHAMMTISDNGMNWRWWSTYTNGDYKKHLSEALLGQKAVGDASTANVTSGVTQMQHDGSNQPSSNGVTIFDSFTRNVVYTLLGSMLVISGVVLIFHPDINGIAKKGVELASIA